jgi:hypothetical protein
MGLKHFFHSVKADPADPTIIGATKWNDDHYYVDGAGAPVGNVGALLLAGAAGALTHLNSVAAGSVLTSAGVGALPVWAAPSGGGPAPGSPLQVDRLGVGTAPHASLSGSVTLAAAGIVQWAARSALTSPEDGVLMVAAAANQLARINFGGNTSAHPSLVRSGAQLQVMSGDISQYLNFQAAVLIASTGVIQMNGPELRSGAGVPEGVVAAPVGSLFLRNDGGPATTLYVKQGGAGGATGWVAK